MPARPQIILKGFSKPENDIKEAKVFGSAFLGVPSLFLAKPGMKQSQCVRFGVPSMGLVLFQKAWVAARLVWPGAYTVT